MRALVLADGASPTRAALDAAWPDWDVPLDLVIAADGGARLADSLGLPIDRWVGDGDSLGGPGIDALRTRGVSVDLAPADKAESDAELGLLAAAAAGATDLVLLGALAGPRPDHALANIVLLGHPALRGRRVTILDPAARIRFLEAPDSAGQPVWLLLPGRIGDTVSLLPLEDVHGVTTEGLRFPLSDESLDFGPTRGLSNIRVATTASVRIRSGRLLVIEAPARLST